MEVELCRALHGRVQNHQRLMLNHQIAHIESVSDAISGLDDDIKKNRIDEVGNPGIVCHPGKRNTKCRTYPG